MDEVGQKDAANMGELSPPRSVLLLVAGMPTIGAAQIPVAVPGVQILSTMIPSTTRRCSGFHGHVSWEQINYSPELLQLTGSELWNGASAAFGKLTSQPFVPAIAARLRGALQGVSIDHRLQAGLVTSLFLERALNGAADLEQQIEAIANTYRNEKDFVEFDTIVLLIVLDIHEIAQISGAARNADGLAQVAIDLAVGGQRPVKVAFAVTGLESALEQFDSDVAFRPFLELRSTHEAILGYVLDTVPEIGDTLKNFELSRRKANLSSSASRDIAAATLSITLPAGVHRTGHLNYSSETGAWIVSYGTGRSADDAMGYSPLFSADPYLAAITDRSTEYQFSSEGFHALEAPPGVANARNRGFMQRLLSNIGQTAA